ncbi:MAG TPA: HAD family hydrolase [Stellaceae bacterium]
MSAAPPRPRAVLFDWDNTLVDTWDTIHRALAVTFTAMGHEPWTMAETKLRVARSLRDSFPVIFGERWEEARKLYLDTFTSIHLDDLRATEGAAELLADLGAAGFYLGVVSNKTGRVLRREAEHLGWTPHFKRLVGAGDAVLDKPQAAPIRLALDGSGIGFGETWYVGDTALDMECAKNAGCVGVLLGARPLEEESFARFPPDLHFPACAALSRYVIGL